MTKNPLLVSSHYEVEDCEFESDQQTRKKNKIVDRDTEYWINHGDLRPVGRLRLGSMSIGDPIKRY